MQRADPHPIPEARDEQEGIKCLSYGWVVLQRLKVFLPAATQSSLPSHLLAEIVLEVVEAHLIVDLAIRGNRLVGVFFDEACLQVGVEVFGEAINGKYLFL
jgi:hypothetical protein